MNERGLCPTRNVRSQHWICTHVHLPRLLGHGIIFRLVHLQGQRLCLLVWREVVEGFVVYVQIIQIIISIALIVVILAQARGSGGLGGIFGGEGGVYRTRRGVEKTLFNVTVGLAVAFFFVSILSVLVA